MPGFGLEELRVKESDRLSAIALGLEACGIAVDQSADGLVVHGSNGAVAGGGHVVTNHDHRIAMAFAILGLTARHPVTIDDDRMIATSFPNFVPLARQLGAALVPLNR